MTVMAQELEVTYRVEVSGWDSNQEFFVEKAELEWSEEAGKVVCLTRPVTAGALLFCGYCIRRAWIVFTQCRIRRSRWSRQ